PGSGAEFDKGLGVGRLGDLVGVEFEDGAFGAGRVVLGQLGDVLEQGAAACVVEPLGWELFGAEGQAFGDVLTQGLVEITGGQNAVYPKHAVSPLSLEDVSEAGAAAATGTSVSGGGGSRFGRAWPRRVSRRAFGATLAPARRVRRRGRPLLPAHARWTGCRRPRYRRGAVRNWRAGCSVIRRVHAPVGRRRPVPRAGRGWPATDVRCGRTGARNRPGRVCPELPRAEVRQRPPGVHRRPWPHRCG